MASTRANDLIIYTFIDENESSRHLGYSVNNQNDDISYLFRLKVQELQDLIRVMPENQKIALWDCWYAAQKFINSCFGKVLEGSNIKEHIGLGKHPEEPFNSHEMFDHHDTSCLDIPIIKCKAETLHAQETFKTLTECHNKAYEEMRDSDSVVDDGDEFKIMKDDGSIIWASETEKAAEAIAETDHIHDETVNIGDKDVNKSIARTSVSDIQSMSSDQNSMNSTATSINIANKDAKSSGRENIVHVQVEKINGIKQNIKLGENLPIDENDPVIILQDEDVFNEYVKTEENCDKKSHETWEIHQNNKDHNSVTKLKKRGRPRKEEYSKLCKPVTKEDGTTVFQCEVCGVQMTHYPNLKVHLRSHTGQRPFCCTKCPKSFTTKGNLKEHEATHDTDRPQYKCETCGKFFKQFKCLKIHARIHTGEKPYKCTVCDKSFSQPGILQSHLLIHSDQRNHQCITCGKCFRLKSQLEVHKKRHENRKDFKCDLCSFEAITRSELLRHVAVHESEKKFSCLVCQKKFTRAQYLKEHMNLHEGKTPHHCSDCGAGFSLATKLYSHRRKHRREMAEQLLREAQSQSIETQSGATVEALHNNQSVSLKIDDRSVEIKSVKLPEYAAKEFVKYTENKTSLDRIHIDNSVHIEKELLVITNPGISKSTRIDKNGVPQLTENLWAGDEQYVELVIGQDISVEDLNSLITSKVISFRQSEGSLIETTDVHISMQE